MTATHAQITRHIKNWRFEAYALTGLFLLLLPGTSVQLLRFLTLPEVRTMDMQIMLYILLALESLFGYIAFRAWRGYTLVRRRPEKIGTQPLNFAKYGLTQQSIKRYQWMVIIFAFTYIFLYGAVLYGLHVSGVFTAVDLARYLQSLKLPWEVLKILVYVYAPALIVISSISYAYQLNAGFFLGIQGFEMASAIDLAHPYRLPQMGLRFPYTVGPEARRQAVIQAIVAGAILLATLIL